MTAGPANDDATLLEEARRLDAEAMALLPELPSSEGDGTRGPQREAAVAAAKASGNRRALGLFAKADTLYWRVVMAHDRMWHRVARRLPRSFEDGLQEARMGAFRGAVRWNPDGGASVNTYLSMWATAKLIHSARPVVTMGPGTHQQALTLGRVIQQHPNAADDELAALLGVTLAKLEGMRRALRCVRAESLDEVVGAEVGHGLTLRIDTLAAEDPSAEDVLHTRQVAESAPKLLNLLSEREADILRARCGFDGDEGASLADIGRTLDLSRERVRQIEAGALRTLRAHLTPTKTGAPMGRTPEPPTRVVARRAPRPDEPTAPEADGSEPTLLVRPWARAGRDRWHRRSFGGRVLVTVREWLDAADWTPTFGDQSERSCSTLPEALAAADAHLRAHGWTLDGDAPGDRAPAADPAHLEAVRRPPAAPDTGSTWWPGSPLGGPDVRGVRASRWKLLGGWGEKGWRRCLGTRQIVAVRIHDDRAVWCSHVGPECFEFNGGSVIPHTFPFGEDARAAVRSAFADADAYLVRLGMVLTGEPPDVNALLAGHIDAEPAGVVDEIVAALPAPAPAPAVPVLDLGAELRARLAALHAAEALPVGDGWARIDLVGSDGALEHSLSEGPLADEVRQAIGAIIARRRAELLARASRGLS